MKIKGIITMLFKIVGHIESPISCFIYYINKEK